MWRYGLEERDGELVPTVHYDSGCNDIYDTRDEYELDREIKRENERKNQTHENQTV